jgi:pilus assembly protein Flp/PilA
MQTFLFAIKQFATDEGGVTAIEYGLIAALIAVVVTVGFTEIGTRLSSVLTTITNSLPAPVPPAP